MSYCSCGHSVRDHGRNGNRECCVCSCWEFNPLSAARWRFMALVARRPALQRARRQLPRLALFLFDVSAIYCALYTLTH